MGNDELLFEDDTTDKGVTALMIIVALVIIVTIMLYSHTLFGHPVMV